MTAPKLALLILVAFIVPGASSAGEGSEPGGPWLEALFDSMDRNQNGKISREELDRHSGARFQAMDGNADGVVDPEEFAVAVLLPLQKTIDRRFALLDRDGNGRITEDELAQTAVQRFSRLDGDWDGAVTLEELIMARPKGSADASGY